MGDSSIWRLSLILIQSKARASFELRPSIIYGAWAKIWGAHLLVLKPGLLALRYYYLSRLETRTKEFSMHAS